MKKELLKSLDNLEARLYSAVELNISALSTEERQERIKHLAIGWLANLAEPERCQVIDEAALLHAEGSFYSGAESRSAYEAEFGNSVEKWPSEVRQKYLNDLLVGWLASLSPDDLSSIAGQSKGADMH